MRNVCCKIFALDVPQERIVSMDSYNILLWIIHLWRSWICNKSWTELNWGPDLFVMEGLKNCWHDCGLNPQTQILNLSQARVTSKTHHSLCPFWNFQFDLLSYSFYTRIWVKLYKRHLWTLATRPDGCPTISTSHKAWWVILWQKGLLKNLEDVCSKWENWDFP